MIQRPSRMVRHTSKTRLERNSPGGGGGGETLNKCEETWQVGRRSCEMRRIFGTSSNDDGNDINHPSSNPFEVRDGPTRQRCSGQLTRRRGSDGVRAQVVEEQGH